MNRSWAEEKSFFPLILCLILMIHGIVMFIRWQVAEKPDVRREETPAPIVVKFENTPRKQIVESEDSANRTKKDDAFLSDKTRSFDRQTKARVNDSFKGTQRKEGSSGKKKRIQDLSFKDVGGDVGDNPFKVAAQDYSNQKNIQDGDNGNSPNRSVSSTNDYIEDIPLGDITNLNTVEYKYYGFYHRIKQKLEQFWGRSLQAKAEQMAKEGRGLASEDELVTALQIVLDQDGKIVAINVVGSSGIKELDEAAIDSFNQAGPFPNPPKDLIINGRVTIEWGFVVKS